MSNELPKAYDPGAIEQRWADYWVAERLFDVPSPDDTRDDSRKFTMLLPPPNVTGRLHMGHMLNQTEMDILTRWHRMLGETAMWIPGTDHAGIATQMMVERQLASEGCSRQQLGREAFVDRVWQWKQHYGGAILDQMKRLGASVDWSREYFTMDPRLSIAVKEAFVRLHEQGLIYRGAYVVNWCPRCQTAISDLEVIHEEQQSKLWQIRYPLSDGSGSLVIATTRPETMLGDVAVAVSFGDPRYADLVGKTLRLPLVGRDIPILVDEWVDPAFGTGAVKVTPAHDPNDFAIGQRHNLPSINVMDDAAHINEAGGPYAGLDRFDARAKIVSDLEALGLLVAVTDHQNAIGKCDRCKTIVEPRLSKQWFVKIQPLADKAIQAVEQGHIRFTPDQYRKTYDEWMRNIHDWCISRQLWWGHRIPAWHCAHCPEITVAHDTPTTCAHCGAAATSLTQETDVLDTWFSSGLLPFTVFGWPGATETQTFESIREAAEGEGTYQRETGPSGNFASVKIHIEPNPAGKGYEFSNLAADSNLPEKYVKAVDQGIRGAMRGGVLHGRSMTDIKVSLLSGTDHPTDSNELAFEIAGSEAFRDAARRAKPFLLEKDGLATTPDLAAFYPTELLVTGFDILFFWVARMIMLGCHFMLDVPMPDGSPRTLAEAVPFRDVYIHALVRDADRQKMSKTKGNVIDPIDIIGRFGTDAVRFTLASMASPGTDIAFNEERTEGYRAFANKIWNAARFLFMNIERAQQTTPAGAFTPTSAPASALPANTPLETRWIYSRLSRTAEEVNRALAAYRFDEAANAVYQFFWGDLCDWYLELIKLRLNFVEGSQNLEAAASLATITSVFDAALRLLSPFMPFITEEIWHALWQSAAPAKSIALTRFPQPADYPADDSAVQQMEALQQLIVTVRGLRKELGVPEKEATPILLFAAPVTGSLQIGPLAQANADMLAKMARVSEVQLASAPLTGEGTRGTASFDVAIVYERQIDIPAERERLSKDLAKYEKGLTAAERQLGNDAFMAKAPAHIIDGLRKQAAETKILYDKAARALEALPPAG